MKRRPSTFILIFGLVLVTTVPILGAQVSWEEGQFRDFSLRYRLVGSELEVEMEAPTTGWVSVGFMPEFRMRGADIFIGYVRGSRIVLEDHYGVSSSAHRPDDRIGGSQQLRIIEGSEEDGVTRIRFAIEVERPESVDKTIPLGREIPIIWAYGSPGADNLTALHVARGGATITIPLRER